MFKSFFLMLLNIDSKIRIRICTRICTRIFLRLASLVKLRYTVLKESI